MDSMAPASLQWDAEKVRGAKNSRRKETIRFVASSKWGIRTLRSHAMRKRV
ncbi:MAG: hypothetical protein KGL02_08100 [Acidobacteriota bacterium]|nr:hypothetical protein [Acidobacteriota bacterium]